MAEGGDEIGKEEGTWGLLL